MLQAASLFNQLLHHFPRTEFGALVKEHQAERGAIAPGNSAASRLIARVTHAKTPMPPTGPRLTDEEVALLERWIDQGAKYARHWSFDNPFAPRRPAA